MNTNKLLLIACLAAFTQPALAADAPAQAPTTNKPSSPLAVSINGVPTQAQAASPAKPAGPLTVTVNGVTTPALYADIVRNDLLKSRRPATDRNVINTLVDNELMSQEAIRLGLDKPGEIQALLDLQRKDLLGKVLVEDFIKKHPVAEARAKAEYDLVKARSGEKEFKSRHILVDNEKLAKSLITQLNGKKPPKFEDLAKKHSKDPGSAKQGGDLGWMAPSNFVPEFAKALTEMKKGSISKAPIKTQFGWHIIQLEDERKVEFPEFDKVKDRIVSQLMQQDVRKFLGELRSTAKIEGPAAN